MKEKPECKLIGEGENIFNLMGIASNTLKRNGYEEEAQQMCNRVLRSADYYDALRIMEEYIEIV